MKEEDVKSEASFVEDLGADSLDTVELVMALEEEFDIEIPDEEAEKITTVQSAIDYVQTINNFKLGDFLSRLILSKFLSNITALFSYSCIVKLI